MYIRLQDLSELAYDLRQSFVENSSWPELTFNEEDQKQLSEIPRVIKVNKHSIQLEIKTKNVIYIPSQYISMAVKIKPFAVEIKKYVDVIEVLKEANGADVLTDFIKKKSDLPVNDVLHEDDYDLFRKMFSLDDSSYRFKAKSIINVRKKNIIVRTDFVGSVILKIINTPDSSSSVLGSIVHALTYKPVVYDYLESRFTQKVESDIDKFEVITQNSGLRWIIYLAWKYCLENFGEEKLLTGYSVKSSKIAGKSYKGIIIPQYFGADNLLGIFDKQQDAESLKSAKTSRFIDEKLYVLGEDFVYFSSQWYEDGEKGKKLNLVNFNRYISDVTEGKLQIIKDGNIYTILKSVSSEKGRFYNQNVIFFGAPGTGKSHMVKDIIKDVSSESVQRIIFHPDYDYTSFVGGYKPVTVFNTKKQENEIQYNFQPEVFTNMYVEAWKNTKKHYYLVIEEINRGNSAEIFGDVFQLLDRNPEYRVTPSENLKKYLEQTIGIGNEGFEDGKMTMPENLTILATMNTSDQSLFPMDSAFKRRWNWEYVEILTPSDENDKSSESYEFVVMINKDEGFRWIDFMKKINKHISKPFIGMDKCLGNYFIKPDKSGVIEISSFVHKVIFYLWNDVFKDEDNIVFDSETNYHSFFPVHTKGETEVRKILDLLKVEVKSYGKTSQPMGANIDDEQKTAE